MAADELPEYLEFEDEHGNSFLAAHSHYTQKGVVVYEEVTVPIGNPS
jgi:hypothetical protein